MSKMYKLKINLRGMITYLREKPTVFVYFDMPASHTRSGYVRTHLDATHIGIRRVKKVVKAFRKYGDIDFVSCDTGEVLFII